MAKRDDIIETAIFLFNNNNYSTIGVDRIIEESHVAKMTFYKYFPSKEALINECLKVRGLRIKESILCNLETCNTPLEKLKAIYDWHINWFKSDNFHGCMFQKAMMDILTQYPSIIEPISDYRSWLSSILNDITNKAGVKNSNYFVDLFIFILNGITMQSKLDKTKVDIDSTWLYILKMYNLE